MGPILMYTRKSAKKPRLVSIATYKMATDEGNGDRMQQTGPTEVSINPDELIQLLLSYKNEPGKQVNIFLTSFAQ